MRRLLLHLSFGTLAFGTLALGTLALGTLALGTLALGTACTPAAPTLTTTELQIHGMVCASCSEAITYALQKQVGVASVVVDHVSGKAVIRHDPAHVQRDALVHVVTALGYTVAP